MILGCFWLCVLFIILCYFGYIDLGFGLMHVHMYY